MIFYSTNFFFTEMFTFSSCNMFLDLPKLTLPKIAPQILYGVGGYKCTSDQWSDCVINSPTSP